MNFERSQDLFRFIVLREMARRGKEAGASRPWVEDPIISAYRFCNVHRENDRVTKVLRRLLSRQHHDVWFEVVASRLLNNPESFAIALPHLLPWRHDRFVRKLHEHREAGNRLFNAAYIVSTNGRSMDKVEFIADYALTPMWTRRAFVRPQHKGETLRNFHSRLMEFEGIGSFLAGQVVADTKFVDFCLMKVPDWYWWAASGPGSRRGLNRVLDRPVNSSWKEEAWLGQLKLLKEDIDERIERFVDFTIEPISAQDLQNCLCEFDKYERARLGEGRPKQIYKPHTEN